MRVPVVTWKVQPWRYGETSEGRWGPERKWLWKMMWKTLVFSSMLKQATMQTLNWDRTRLGSTLEQSSWQQRGKMCLIGKTWSPEALRELGPDGSLGSRRERKNLRVH